MDMRIRELIAIGASITAHCQPCLQYHIAKAVESGADRSEIMAAIEVGKMVRRGAAAKMDTFAASLAQAATSENVADLQQDCGCGSPTVAATTGVAKADCGCNA